MINVNKLINRKSILFVASDNEYISRLTLMIKDEGYAHFIANDMAKARKIIPQEKPDVVLVAWEYHKQAENFRGLCKQPYSTVIVMADEHITSKALYEILELGIDDYLQEPLDEYMIKGKMRLYLRLTQAMRISKQVDTNQQGAKLISSSGLGAEDLDISNSNNPLIN